MNALFDTNILIDYLVGVEAAKVELARYSKRAISIVTWMETLTGARSAAEEEVTEMFLRDFDLVPLTKPIARAAVDYRRRTRVRLPDAIIWASAQEVSALFVTRNTKDFSTDDPGVRVPY